MCWVAFSIQRCLNATLANASLDRSRESLQKTLWMSVQTIADEEGICGNTNSTEQNPLLTLICIFCICALGIALHKSIVQKIMISFYIMYLSMGQIFFLIIIPSNGSSSC